MRKICCIATALALGIMTQAQSKLDLTSRAMLRLGQLQRQELSTSKSGKRLLSVKKELGGSGTFGENVIGFVSVENEPALSELEKAGAIIYSSRGNVAIVSMPVDSVEKIASLGCVTRARIGRPLSTNIDKARQSTGVDKIHAGDGLTQSYTGRGVVAGIVDGGMDPNHINFRNPDGTSRIGYFGHLRLNTMGDQLLETHYDASTVKNFTTDDRSTFHGTHTMGILAGGYRGNLDVAVEQPDGSAITQNIANPYYGVACEADIAAACGVLVDAVIAYGIDYILDYAYRSGKRSVINLSLGSNMGPHDGSDVIQQYFDAAVKQDNAIICISAGNEGDLPLSLSKTLAGTDTVARTFIRPYIYTDMRQGTIEVYSNDETEFTFKAVIFNKKRGRVSYEMPIYGNTYGEAVNWVSSNEYMSSSNDIMHKNFTDAFDGYVSIASTVDPVSGRYYTAMSYFTVDSDKNNDGNYILGFVIEGKDGQRIDCFCDGYYTALDSYNIDGWENGSFNGTISDMACGKNTIAVGSYNTRDSWPSLDGYIYGYDGAFPEGEISSFSSFGTLVDGRNLPHVCAPGAAIISSTSSYFVNAAELSPSYIHAELKEPDRSNQWEQTTGTSMASPHVAGSIALWLEADPTLTVDDVKDIIAATATRDNVVLTSGDPVQWGAGKFNAIEGLKEVLRRANNGIDNIAVGNVRPVITGNGNGIYGVFLGGAESLDVKVFDTTGKLTASMTAAGDETDIDLSRLSAGVYIINVNGLHSQRLLIK